MDKLIRGIRLTDILKLSQRHFEHLISRDCSSKKIGNVSNNYWRISLSNTNDILFPPHLYDARYDSAKVHGAAYGEAWQMHPVPLTTHSAMYTCRIIKGATRGRCRSVDFRSSQIARGPSGDIFLNEPPPVARHRRCRQRFSFSRGTPRTSELYTCICCFASSLQSAC